MTLKRHFYVGSRAIGSNNDGCDVRRNPGALLSVREVVSVLSLAHRKLNGVGTDASREREQSVGARVWFDFCSN